MGGQPISTDQKARVANLTEIPEKKYATVDLDHLVMYAVGVLGSLGVDLSFENIVVAAFRLFPNKFSLLGYSSYPDAKRVHKCLRRCTYKTRQWLGGKERQGFAITERSEQVIAKSRCMIEVAGLVPGRAHSATRRKERLLSEVESSLAYVKILKGESDSVSEGDFCFLLQGTLDSSGQTLRATFKR